MMVNIILSLIGSSLFQAITIGCLLSCLFFCLELENDELCFCCLQFGGMFLAPMMLLMGLTLPLENV